jgi:hypothetical protein
VENTVECRQGILISFNPEFVREPGDGSKRVIICELIDLVEKQKVFKIETEEYRALLTRILFDNSQDGDFVIMCKNDEIVTKIR